MHQHIKLETINRIIISTIQRTVFLPAPKMMDPVDLCYDVGKLFCIIKFREYFSTNNSHQHYCINDKAHTKIQKSTHWSPSNRCNHHIDPLLVVPATTWRNVCKTTSINIATKTSPDRNEKLYNVSKQTKA